MTTPYIPPPWLIGSGDRFVLTASEIASRNGPWACPGRTAHDARRKAGTVQTGQDDRWTPTWDDSEQLFFALRDGLAALHDGSSPRDAAALNRNLTAAQRRFVLHALHELQDLEELIAASAGEPLHYQGGSSDFVRAGWGQVKLTGPEYADPTGKTRETVRLKYTPFRDPDGRASHTQDYAAVAAMVLASDDPSRQRLRVSEFSLADGAYRVLFDGSPVQAQEFYASRGHPHDGHLVLQTLQDTELRPGSACGGCWFLQVCPAPQRLPSALGIDKAVATRALSGSDLTLYDECPARFHAQRRSHLPARPADGAAAEDFTPRNRGVATHQFLRWAHARAPRRRCSLEDLPDPMMQPDETASLLAEADIDAAAYPLARPYLLGHLRHCIVGFDGLDDVSVEPRHVIYDEYADVVVSVEPDLTVSSGVTSRIWRETKTRAAAAPRDEYEALNAYPAFALHVTLLAAGAGGNGRDDGAAELEVLTPNPDESQLFIVPIADGTLVSHAQRITAAILLRWSQDLRFEPQPSSACLRCPVHGWCDPPPSAMTRPVEPDDDEFLGLPDPF